MVHDAPVRGYAPGDGPERSSWATWPVDDATIRRSAAVSEDRPDQGESIDLFARLRAYESVKAVLANDHHVDHSRSQDQCLGAALSNHCSRKNTERAYNGSSQARATSLAPRAHGIDGHHHR